MTGDNVVPFPRRPLPGASAAVRLGADRRPELLVECEPPTIHLFMNGVPGAVCQCGQERWADIPGHENITWEPRT